MPDSAQTLVDSVIAISLTLPTAFTSATAGYPSLTFKDVGQITNWTPGGKTYQVTTSNPINQRSTDKYKGTYNNNADNITLNRDDDDLGQIDVLAALDMDEDVAFEVTYQDGSIDYFTGKVVSFDTGAGGANDMVTRTLQIERTRDTVTVAAA